MIKNGIAVTREAAFTGPPQGVGDDLVEKLTSRDRRVAGTATHRGFARRSRPITPKEKSS